MDKGKRDTVLGLVFFGTLGLLLVATVTLTDLSLAPVDPLRVYVDDAGGIRVGDPVMVLGKRVGKVDSVDFILERRRNRILVVLRLDEEVPLFSDYSIEIQETSVLGGRQVQIDPGVGDARREGEELVGRNASSPLNAFGETFEGKGPIGENLEEFLDEIALFFRNLNNPDTTIGSLATKRELYDEVYGVFSSLKRTVEAIERGDGLVGRIINDTTLRDDVVRVITNLAVVSEALRSTEGPLGRLINDQEMGANLAQILADGTAIASDLRAGKGALGRVLRDDKMGQDLADTIAGARDLMSKATDPDAGVLGAVVADPQLRDDLRDVMSDLAQVTSKLNEGEGLLAVLLNDADLAERVRRLFAQVTRAVEDAREAAPIGTFFQVLSGAF